MYLSAFRTHLWDGEIRKMADNFRANASRSHFVVTPDETRGRLDIEGFEVCPHTSDFSALGLPEYPAGRSLWYNGDYPLYALADAYPDHDYFVMSEFDVAVNTDVDDLVEAVAARGIHLVAHDIRRAEPEWFWYDNARTNFAEPFRSLIFFLVVSREAVGLLRRARLDGAARTPDPDASWPFCETFVPSTIAAAGLAMAELSEFVSTNTLGFRPHYVASDERVRRWGTISHPVLGRSRFVPAVLAEHDAATWFDPASALRAILATVPHAEILPLLAGRYAATRDHVSMGRLRVEAAGKGIPIELAGADPTDLALCRPALTSSVSPWSVAQDAALDAAGANGIATEPVHGFHTASEPDPWWMVDLEGEAVVDRVEIVNRRGEYRDRFRRFVIESSRDGAAWHARAWHLDEDVSGDEETPWSRDFADPFVARHVRIRVLGHTPMHLRRVRVRGRRIPPP